MSAKRWVVAAVLHGNVNAILITGGIAYSAFICDYIKAMVEFVAPGRGNPWGG